MPKEPEALLRAWVTAQRAREVIHATHTWTDMCALPGEPRVANRATTVGNCRRNQVQILTVVVAAPGEKADKS